MSGSRRRVVITGIGAATPLGLTAHDTWKNVIEGRSGIATVTLTDMTGSPVTIAGEVKGFDPHLAVGPFRPGPDMEITQAMSTKDIRKFGRFVHLAMVAGLEAYGDSGLDPHRQRIDAHRMGVNIGVGMGGLNEIEEVHNDFLAKGYRRVTPFFIPMVIANMASGQLAITLNLQGSNLCNVTACTSSAHSLGESFRQIQRGDMDVIVAGGAEAVVGRLGIAGFASMKALSTRNDAPEKASRPWDRDRDGFVMGEGACITILEEYEHARKRGAKIYAEIKGYGLSSDAYHITSPSPEGEGGARAMRMALSDAGLNPEQIAYINAHGTSTPAGDLEEARAVARTFPRSSEHLNVSSTKSMTGHLLGAAGAIESMFCALAIRDGVIPPTINLDNPDPACADLKLDFTPLRAVEKRVDYALSNSFGFGGTNASLIFGRV